MTKLCVKNSVVTKWCVEEGVVKDGVWEKWCERWCVTKWCVKEGVSKMVPRHAKRTWM